LLPAKMPVRLAAAEKEPDERTKKLRRESKLGKLTKEQAGERASKKRLTQRLGYSRKQRDSESGAACRRLRKHHAKPEAVHRAEEALAAFDHRTPSLASYQAYVTEARQHDECLHGFYSQRRWAVDKFRTWSGIRRSETRLVLSLLRKWGPNVVIAMGDWSRRPGSRVKGRAAPTERLLRILGQFFIVVVLHEAYTSKTCAFDHGPVKEDGTRRDHYIDRDGKVCHRAGRAICRCPNESCRATRLARDANAALNMAELLEHRFRSGSWDHPCFRADRKGHAGVCPAKQPHQPEA